MQLSFDAADRLVELIEARHGPVTAEEAARTLFALSSAPAAIARSLLEDVVAGDARLVWHGAAVGLAAAPGAGVALEDATFVVVDLETTGLSPASSRICEIGAQRVEALRLTDSFETFVDPGVPVAAAVVRLTGIHDGLIRGAPRAEPAVRRLLAFAGEAVLVAHNARFDVAFLDREVQRLSGKRIAAPVVDTVWLARRLLGDRVRRVGLAALAHFFGTSVEPCHRALPDAQATAEILLRLIGLAQERGARTVDDLVALAAPRARRLHAKRSLAAGAPSCPGTYVFRDGHGQPLYVGKAGNLRTRLRSYFSGERQRPAVEAALAALAAIQWTECGSELEAALRELQLLRSWRPPANAQATRPDRYVYLQGAGGRWRVVTQPTPFGPLKSRRSAQRAVRALDGHTGADPREAVPPLQERMRRLARAQRFEDAARLRDRIEGLEEALTRVDELRRLRRIRLCLVAPARERGFVHGFFVVHGRIAAERLVPLGGGALAEARAGIAAALRVEESLQPEHADELVIVGRVLRHPPPELRICPLEAEAIVRAAHGVPLAA